ncbi:MAG: hypothetical protein J6S73_07940 [Lentisphaeria bacterium]|nr:hypothetical protein [Lentisphaeria bacterium]
MAITVFDGAVNVGGTPFRLGGVRLGMFDESTALQGKERLHESMDGMVISGKTEKTIPFGCEYAVIRNYERAEGILRAAVDVRALNGGVVDHCELDPLTVAGNVVRAGILGDDGKTEWINHAGGTAMPRAVEIELADGTVAELMSGDDLWRHRAAAVSGGSSCWEMSLADGKLSFTRTMLKYPEDAEPSNRSGRWEYNLVWGKPGAAAVPADAETVDCSGICFASPAQRRRFRDLVRQAKTPLHLVNVAAGLCGEASHTGRNRELVHQDTGDLLAFLVWANRTLKPRGLQLTAALTAEAAENRPALASVLANFPE